MLSVPSAAATVPPEQQAPSSLPPQAQARARARRKLWFFTTLAAIAGVAGASALGSGRHRAPVSEVRSGSPGFRTAKSGQHLNWRSNALTIHLDDSLGRIGPHASEAVMQAFGRWVQSDQRLPDLSFDTGKTSAVPTHDGKSTVSYSRITARGHEQDLAITVTYSDDHSGEIIEADIVLNSIYPIGVLTPSSTSSGDREGKHGPDQKNGDDKVVSGGEASDCQNRYDVQNVVTHEAGHFFGLGEDPVEREAAMFQTIDQCETHKRTLAATDVAALTTLYAETANAEETAAGPRACSFVAAPGGASWGWISGLIVGLALARRRR